MRNWLAAAFLFVGPLLTSTQQATVRKVEASLLSPCCYSQAVGQHMSDVAEQMRQEITQMAAAGEGETQIVDHYKALYGERILIVPDGETGKVLFALPVIIALALSGVLVLFLRRMLPGNKRAESSDTRHAGTLTSQTILDRVRRETEECY